MYGYDGDSETVNVLAHCAEMLNGHWNTLLQERSFPRIGCAKRGSSADFCNKAVSVIWQGVKESLPPPEKKHVSGGERTVLMVPHGTY